MTKMIKKAILITKEQNDKLNQLIPWGDFSSLIRLILDDVITIMSDRTRAQQLLYLYKMRKISLLDIIKTENKIDDSL